MTDERWNDIPEDDGLFIDTGDLDEGDIECGGPMLDKEGWYIFECANVKPELNDPKKSPCVRCDLVVTGREHPNLCAIGSVHYHRLYVGSKDGPPKKGSIANVIRFCMGLGLMKYVTQNGQKVAVDSETGKPAISMPMLQKIKGKAFACEIGKEVSDNPKFGDKYVIKMHRTWPIDDPKVAQRFGPGGGGKSADGPQSPPPPSDQPSEGEEYDPDMF